MSREAMQQALEALEEWDNYLGSIDFAKEIAALRAALAEPVRLKRGITGVCTLKRCECEANGLGLECIHLAPIKRTEPAPVEQTTMELAESVGLIGPASRTHDLHGAIQRFHDLIVMNASIKAAQQFAATIQQPLEPVAWIEHEWSGTGIRRLHFERSEPTVRDGVVNPVWTPLYARPPQRTEPVPLTDEEIERISRAIERSDFFDCVVPFARAIEAAHGIKQEEA